MLQDVATIVSDSVARVVDKASIDQMRQWEATRVLLEVLVGDQIAGGEQTRKLLETFHSSPNTVAVRSAPEVSESQLRLGLQFQAMKSALGTMSRSSSGRDSLFLPSPEIVAVGSVSARFVPATYASFVLIFVADLPVAATTGILHIEDPGAAPQELPFSVADLNGRALGLDTDNITFVILYDEQKSPVALGIPHRA